MAVNVFTLSLVWHAGAAYTGRVPHSQSVDEEGDYPSRDLCLGADINEIDLIGASYSCGHCFPLARLGQMRNTQTVATVWAVDQEKKDRISPKVERV